MCPKCGSDNVVVNPTSVKGPVDKDGSRPDDVARCLDCKWYGKKKDLK